MIRPLRYLWCTLFVLAACPAAWSQHPAYRARSVFVDVNPPDNAAEVLLDASGVATTGNVETQTISIAATQIMSAARQLQNVASIDATTKASLISALGVSGGLQPYDADLVAIAALANTDSNFIVGNGSTWVAENGATARTSLGVVIGTNVQAWDADLDTLAGLDKDENRFIVGNVTDWVSLTASDSRDALGLGTMATQAASAVAITGGTIAGLTSLGTGTITGTGDVAIDTNVFKVATDTNRVGINVTSPTVALDVSGSVTASGNVTAATFAATSAIVMTGSVVVDSSRNITGTAITGTGDITTSAGDVTITAGDLNLGAGSIVMPSGVDSSISRNSSSIISFFSGSLGFLIGSGPGGSASMFISPSQVTIREALVATDALSTFHSATVATGNVAITAGDLIITTPGTPASASDTGTVGTVAWDSNYIYICTATNTWKRVAIATW